MLGMWDGTVEVGKGVWSVVRHPIKTGKSFVNGTAFIAKALVTNGEEREALYCIWTTFGMEMLSDLEADEAKDTARKVGKFTAQILLAVAAEKGIAKAATALKESAKSGKLSKVSQSWTKTGQKADDFVDDLVAVSVANKFDDFAVITNKFPDEGLPADGKILPATIKDGKISGLDGLRDVDFVVTKQGELIVGKRHAFLAQGEDVIAAGELRLSGHGEILYITNRSGHYQPTLEQATQFELIFSELELDLSKTWRRYFLFEVDEYNIVEKDILKIHEKIIK